MDCKSKSPSAISHRILSYVEEKKCRSVGINGVDTSGKTVFAESLCDYFLQKGQKAIVIHLDDFHNRRHIRLKGETEVDAYIQNAFNLERLVNKILMPHKNKKYIDETLSLLDVARDRFTVKKHFFIEPDTLVILEGVLLFRPPLLDYIDCKIFLDIPFDEVLLRASKRDVPIYGEAILEKYRKKYIPIQKEYLAKFHPKEISDFIIENTDFKNPRAIKLPKDTSAE